MRPLLIFWGALLALSLAAQDLPLRIQLPDGPVPWTSLRFNRPADQFQFAIVTDRTGGIRPGVFNTAIDKLNLLQPEFVMSVGDLIMGYTKDSVELLRQWEEFDAMVDRLDMPFFYVPGNHDLTNKTMEALWRRRLGPTYYHFVYQNVLFLCLNSEDPIRGAGRGAIDDEQYEYIKKTLAENADVRWTLVFLHQPLWEQFDTKRWPEVEELLRDRPHHVFAGHVHHYVQYSRNNGRYYTLATTGGGSRLRGPRLGEFDHVSWVTMTDGGPIIANLALDGIFSDSVTSETDYDFITQLYRSKPIRFKPFLFEEKNFRSGNIYMMFHNPTDLPMRIEIDPGFSFDYTTKLPADTIMVRPNATEDYYWQLRARRPKPLKKLGSIPLKVNLIFNYEGKELRLPFRYRIAPTPRKSLQESGRTKVDGKLREWKSLPHQLTLPDTATCSVDWGMRADNRYLYLAARVTDDYVVARPGTSSWQQDAIGFVLNADPLDASLIDTGEENYRYSLYRAFSPGANETTTDQEESAVDYACRLTPKGYEFEARIPLDYLRERQGTPWRHLRINWFVQDEDPTSSRKPRYWWQPEWSSSENVVGSGLLWREETP